MTVITDSQRTFTVGEYHRMGEAGIFDSQERVELVRGVIRTMSPKGMEHRIAVALALHLFARKLEGRASVQVQDPLTLDDLGSEPEPDVVVTSNPDPRDLATAHPLLVIEVADTSLRFDREVKAPLFAEAGIADYWIVNLVQAGLEVYREPEGKAYRSVKVLKPVDRISPLAFPDLEITVRDLLP